MTITGPAVRAEIPLVNLRAQYESLKDELQEVVLDVLSSCRYVNGEWVARFEHNLAQYVGAKYAIAVGSGTQALELALKAAGVQPNDEVIVPANSFFATAEAVTNVGAIPRFADIDRDTFHVDVSSVERLITRRTRAIIPVHLYGYAMDLRELDTIASRHRLVIIEDAAQVLGAGRGGAKVGSSGRLTCFSFYPGKNLGACGEAGAITCNDSRQAETIRLFREHGSPSKYEHTIVGTNARMDSIQAAVLDVKLKYLDGWNKCRNRHAQAYMKALSNASVGCPRLPLEGEHNFHLFVIKTRDRDRLRRHLGDLGVATGIHYPVPLHLTEAYQDLGYPGPGSAPRAEQLSKDILSLPMFPELENDEIDFVANAIVDFLSERRSSSDPAF